MDINELLSKFDSGQLIGLVLGGIALLGGSSLRGRRHHRGCHSQPP